MYGGYDYLSGERTSIAEVMAKEGYSTAAFHTNPLLSSAYNYHRGFDTFYDSIGSNISFLKYDIKKKLGNLVLERKELEILFSFIMKLSNLFQVKRPYKVPYDRAEILTRKAINWLRGRSNRFFIWIHYVDPHYPWIPPHNYFPSRSVSIEESIKLWRKMVTSQLDPSSLSNEELKKMITLYDSEIRYVDYAIGNLFYELRKEGLYDNSLVIVTSDHGEEFKEHGDIDHKPKLYEELIHVPLVIKFPNGLYGGTIVNDLVSLIDLAPTIVDCLGINKPKKWVGSSLFPLLEGRKGSKREGVISEAKIKQGHNIISYRTKRWKYILNEEKGEQELYDLQEDPKETKNLFKIMPKRVKKFEAKISKHLSHARASSIREITRKRIKLLKKHHALKKIHNKNK